MPLPPGTHPYDPLWPGLTWEDDNPAYPGSAERFSQVSDQVKGLTARVSGGSLAAVEARTPAYTIYLDQLLGNDANAGNAPGAAVQTLSKAIALLQQAGHGGRVGIVTGGAAGFLDVAAPISLVQPIKIEALTPNSSSIRRTYATPNGRSVWDAVTTAGGSSVTSATAAFVAGDVNRIISVYGAGVGSGTYYDFISAVPDGTHATLTATTTIARNSTTDPKGVKCSVVGDWHRVVTDAAMTAGGSIVTSATAAWTSADIGTEIVIAGAGQGGQALRSAIKSVSGNTATIIAVASATVSGARCAIRVNFGDLLTCHVGQSGLANLLITDQTTGNASIGAAIKIICDDGGAGSQLSPSDLVLRDVEVTSTDTAGAWEHILDCDGTWNQASGGPGARRVCIENPKFFGARRPTESIRLVSAVHWSILGGLSVPAPLPSSVTQGIMILDPQKTGGGSSACQDINFAGFEAQDSYFYCEGAFNSFVGGRIGATTAVSGRVAIELGATSDNCTVICTNAATVNQTETNSGTNNTILTNASTQFVLNGAVNGKNVATLLQLLGGSAGANFKIEALATATLRLYTVNNADIDVGTNSVYHQRFAKQGSFIAQLAGALATSATDGFLYLPSCAGVPTGTPTAVTGAVPEVVDSTNGNRWIYVGGAWKRANIDRTQLRLGARRLIAETFDLGAGRDFPTSVATAGSVWRVLVGLAAGDVITGLICHCQTSAGSGLTLAKMGVVKKDGTLGAATATFHGTLATGFNPVAINGGPYTVPTDDGWFLAFLAVGTTGPTLTRSTATGSITGASLNSGAPVTDAVSAQTDLVTVAINPNTGVGFYLAAY